MSSPELCCARCFGDRSISRELIYQVETVQGDCPRCGSLSVACAKPTDFYQWFSSLLASYEEDDAGEKIDELLHGEWQMFSPSPLASTERRLLIAQIMGDYDLMDRRFRPIGVSQSESLKSWEKMREELMHVNRWFISSPIDLERLRDLLDRLVLPRDEFAAFAWYRGRRLGGRPSFSAQEMGAPPKEFAGNGRVNPAGIRCLYVASSQEVAASELRPHPGERISVAEVKVPEYMKIADLRDPRGLVSPLLLDESIIKRVREDLPFLQRLGEELTKPVLPDATPYQYAPTQYLCELIKERGFDGVMYRSAMASGEGVNLALFDPDGVTVCDPTVVTIGRVTLAMEVT